MKKILSVLMASVMVLGLCSGCGSGNSADGSSDAADASGAMASGSVGVDGNKIVKPIDNIVNIKSEGTDFADITFNASDVTYDDNGTGTMTVKIWAPDVYDAAEVNALEPGDSIVIMDKEMKIETIEESQNEAWESTMMTINGGTDNGGCQLVVTENGNYNEIVKDDLRYVYKETVTMPVSADWQLIDLVGECNMERLNFKEFYDQYAQSGKTFDNPDATWIKVDSGVITGIVLW